MLIINQLIKSQGWSGRERIEISEIPQSIEQIGAPVAPQNIESCNRLKSDDNGQSNKVIE